MSILTLRLWLSGPLQAWGTSSRFDVRTTELVPSKSGVIGLLCAALGRPRDEPVDDLAALRFGVRVERAGSVLRDYHTVGAGARGVAVANGSKGRGIQTERYYLQDAAFVVGLEGEDERLLRGLHRAVLAPRWLLALGRRSCPPAGPLTDDRAVFPGPLQEALSELWRPARPADEHDSRSGSFARSRRETIGRVELLMEDPDGPLYVQDQPLGAAFDTRAYAARRLRSTWVVRKEVA